MKKLLDLLKSIFENASAGQKTVIFIIDGLGKTDLELQFKRETYETVFPTTTTAFFYTFNTLLPPGEHGFLEWYGKYDKSDEPVISLISETASEKKIDIPPEQLFPFKSIFKTLSEKGLKIAFFAPHVGNALSKLIYDDKANTRKLRSLSGIFPIPDFDILFVYWPEIDSILHEKWKDESFFVELGQIKPIIERLVKKLPKGTDVFIFSDHGHKKCDQDVVLKEINGILPYGGGRSAFYNSQGDFEGFKEKIKKEIYGDYSIHHISKFKDILGGTISKRCIEQYGDIVLVAGDNSGFRFPYVPKHKKRHLGFHGGLSEEEREVYVWTTKT